MQKTISHATTRESSTRIQQNNRTHRRCRPRWTVTDPKPVEHDRGRAMLHYGSCTVLLLLLRCRSLSSSSSLMTVSFSIHHRRPHPRTPREEDPFRPDSPRRKYRVRLHERITIGHGHHGVSSFTIFRCSPASAIPMLSSELGNSMPFREKFQQAWLRPFSATFIVSRITRKSLRQLSMI